MVGTGGCRARLVVFTLEAAMGSWERYLGFGYVRFAPIQRSRRLTNIGPSALGMPCAPIWSDLTHIGVLNRAEVGTRGSGWNGVFPSMRHPKLSQVPALHKLEWWSGYLFGVLPTVAEL